MATDFSSAALSSLRRIEDRIAEIFTNYGKERIRIATTPALRYGATADEVERKRVEMVDQIEAVKNSTLARYHDLRDEIARLQKDLTADIERALGRSAPVAAVDQLIQETREARSWGRLKPILDREGVEGLEAKVGELARIAFDAGDADMISVLRNELHYYLLGRGGMVYEPIIRAALDREMSKADPGLASALQARIEADKGVTNLTTAISFVEHAINTGEDAVTISTWDSKGRALTIGAVTVLGVRA
ncbi:MAG: hypothetical protein AB7U82_08305 [Blastocatellales bacterium]